MTDLGIPGVGDAHLIASGGSARVYRAISHTGEPVAVKVLRGVRGTEVTRRFEREISAAERLSGHPNIMRILHTGITGAGEPYLVMPLMPDGSLSEELERSGSFSLQKATADVALAAEALQFAHDHGVLHRDIKPANLLRAEDGSIVVSDFGIARVVDAGISSATLGANTPLYAAPELLADNAASARSEVYSLAALLYALLAGRPAFADSDNLWATMHRVRTEAPAPIDGVPAPVMAVILQAMAKEPGDRPQTALQFREVLRQSLTENDAWRPPAPATVELEPEAQPQPAAQVQPATPPVPPRHRPAPVVGTTSPETSPLPKFLAAAAALILIAALGWWGTTRLLDRDQPLVAPPIDNSLPEPAQDPADSPPDPAETDTDTESGAETAEEVTIEDLPAPADIPNTFVSFSGDHFSALLPEGWSLAARDIEETYGFRSMFVNDTMYMNIDTTPKEQREAGGDIGQSARDIAASINSASEVRTEVVDGLTMHSFTFRNQQGVDSIDIFFEVDGDGYAVVAGSATEPDTAFSTARLVALSIRSNPT